MLLDLAVGEQRLTASPLALQTKLRIGLAEQSVLVALGHAAQLHQGGSSDKDGKLAERLEVAAQLVKQAYSECPSYDVVSWPRGQPLCTHCLLAAYRILELQAAPKSIRLAGMNWGLAATCGCNCNMQVLNPKKHAGHHVRSPLHPTNPPATIV